MISVNRRRLYGQVFNEVRCLSTDDKPTDVKNGSICIEIDTGTKYVFDRSNDTWHQLSSGGGGGGGGASIDLGITDAEVGQVATIATVDANGVPTSWTASSVRRTLTVTCVTQDNVTVTGQTVTVREIGPDGPVFAQAAYEGQPVSFRLPVGFDYHVSVTSNLAHHFNPTTAAGVIVDADVSVILTYADFSSIATGPDIKAALDSKIDLTDLNGETIQVTRGSQTLTLRVGSYLTGTGSYAGRHGVELFITDASLYSSHVQFEPPQALAWFGEGLAAGDYKFKNGSTYYYLTLATAIPAGGQLMATTSAFQTYESQSATATLETGTVSTTEIENAFDLGTCGSESGAYPLNNMDRVNYGSNNYGESAIFWLSNTDADAGTLRTPVTKYSRAYAYAVDGFLKGLDQDFLDCVEEIDWLCSANTVYECPASMGGISTKNNPYTVKAKFGLLSEREVFGSYSGVDAGDKVLDVFKSATANDRKWYRGSSAQSVWLRCPYSVYSSIVRLVNTSGTPSYNYAYYSYAAVLACQIWESENPGA